MGVEPVAQRIAHEVDHERGDEDGEAGEGGDPPRVEHVDAALAEHVAPRRGRGLDAQAQEGEERLEDDHLGHLQGRDDHDGGDEVGEDLPEDDPRVAHAEGAAREHELALADGHGLGPHDARVDRPAGHAEHDDHVDEARAEDRDDGEREQHEGKGQHHVDDRHDRPVGAPADVARPEAEQHPDGGRQDHGGHPDHQRDPAAVDHARQEVAAHLVGAEQVLGGAPSIQAGGARRWRMFTASGSWGAIHGASAEIGDDQEEEPAGGQAPAEPQEATERGASRAGRRRRASSRSASATLVGALAAFMRRPGCADR